MKKLFAKNKRRFFRLPTHHLLKYKILGKASNGNLSFARNISTGGVLFHCKDYIEQDSVLELEIDFPTGIIKTKAKVLRTKELKKVGGFDIALEFIGLEEEAKRAMITKIENTRKIINKFRVIEVLIEIILVFGLLIAVMAVFVKMRLFSL